MEIKELPGIYYFYIPELKKGYIGSSINVAKRYKQHISGSHNKILVRYKNSLKFSVLEYLPDQTIPEIRKAEQIYIDKFKAKGISLLNKATPNTSIRQVSKFTVLKYDLNGKLITNFNNFGRALEVLKIQESKARQMLSGIAFSRQTYILIYHKDLDKLKNYLLEVKRLKRNLKEKVK